MGEAARGPASAKWSAADAVLIDEATDLVQRTGSLGHVVLDEAQDLSPMQYRAVGRRCSTGSATILGDLAQGTTPWATASWAEALSHLGKPDARVEELTRGFRVPREVIAYASRLLPAIAPGLAPATSVRESPGALFVRPTAEDGLDAAVLAACRESLGYEGSIGLIAADPRIPALAAALDAAGLPYLSPARRPRRPPGSPWSPRPSPRAWSTTTWSWTTPPRSWRPSPTNGPACAGCTSASPARCRA